MKGRRLLAKDERLTLTGALGKRVKGFLLLDLPVGLGWLKVPG